MYEILKEILEELKKINEKLDDLMNGPQFIDEDVEKIYKEYEKRDLANFIQRFGPPPRLPNECPKCYENGKRSVGIVVKEEEFKNSIAITYECPICGYRWVSQIKKPKS